MFLRLPCLMAWCIYKVWWLVNFIKESDCSSMHMHIWIAYFLHFIDKVPAGLGERPHRMICQCQLSLVLILLSSVIGFLVIDLCAGSLVVCSVAFRFFFSVRICMS